MCVRRARPERANCSRAHEPPRRAPVLAHTAEPRHALPASQHRAKPPWHATAPPPGHSWRHSGVRSGSNHGQCRPNPSRSPPGPWSSASSSAAMSSRASRCHDALLLQNVGSPEAYPRPPRNRLASLINGRLGPFPHTGNLRPPQWRFTSSQSTREGSLPRLWHLLPPPLAHQGLPLSTLSTRNLIFLP